MLLLASVLLWGVSIPFVLVILEKKQAMCRWTDCLVVSLTQFVERI